MANTLSRRPVKHHLGASRGQQHTNPVQPTSGEAHELQDAEEETPVHSVKCLSDIAQGRLRQ